MQNMRLYGIGKTRWNRPYWLLREMGVEFEPVIIDPRVGEHQSEAVSYTHLTLPTKA